MVIQSLEFVVERKTLAEMKIENHLEIYFPWKKNRQAYFFFSMEIKIMDLSLQIESTKLIFVINCSVLHWACPRTPIEVSCVFFFH